MPPTFKKDERVCAERKKETKKETKKQRNKERKKERKKERNEKATVSKIWMRVLICGITDHKLQNHLNF